MLHALETVIHKLPDSALKAGRRKATPRPLRVVPARSSFFRRALLVVAVAAGLGATAATWLRGRHEHSTSGEVATVPAEPRLKKAPRAQPAPPPSPKPAPPPPVPAAPTASPAPSPASPPPTPAKAEPPAGEAHASADPGPGPVKEAPAEEPDEADQPKPSKARDAAAPKTRARNPWKEPVPSALRSIRDRVNHNAHMSQKALQPLYDFAHKNPTDARPWLLLGRAYAQTDWYSDSVDRYVRAYRVDSTSRGDPQMLADLLKGAAHPTAGRAAARAIRDIYGAEAIPALEKAMKARANEKEAIARLTRLRESLPR
jgi:hypothetical protein